MIYSQLPKSNNPPVPGCAGPVSNSSVLLLCRWVSKICFVYERSFIISCVLLYVPPVQSALCSGRVRLVSKCSPSIQFVVSLCVKSKPSASLKISAREDLTNLLIPQFLQPLLLLLLSIQPKRIPSHSQRQPHLRTHHHQDCDEEE
jgi:hypothetical protein